MAMKQFVGLEGSSSDTQSFGPIQKITHGDKIIICLQADNKKTGPCGIVPGFKASEPYETPHRISAIKVETIPEEEKEEVQQTLNGVLQGRILFWS